MMFTYKEVFVTFPAMGPYQLHKALWRWFPDADGRRPFLYRYDRLGETLIVCLRVGPTEILPAKPASSAQLIEVNGPVGAVFDFRIRIVPEIRLGRRVVGLPTNRDAAEWFASKAPNNGFEVCDIDEAISAPLVFRGKHGRKITLNDTVISGRLTVTDSTRFEATLCQGMGRHKGFGFGMLQIHNGGNVR